MPGIYFCGAATLTAIFAGLWFALPRRRPGSLVAASALAPFGFLGYVFVPGYWRPDHLIQIVPGVGVEDFLICFSEGGLAWLLSGYGRRLDGTTDAGSWAGSVVSRRMLYFAALTRFSLVAGAGGALAILGAALGLATMTAIVLGFTLVGLVVGSRRPGLLPGALVAGPSFALLHVGVGIATLAIWPEAKAFWNGAALTGAALSGLPIEEVAWALAFGACWPMFVQVAFYDVATATSRSSEGANAKSLSATGRRGFRMRERRNDAGAPDAQAEADAGPTRKKITSSSWRPFRLPSFPSSSS